MKEGCTKIKIGDICNIKTGKLDANAASIDGMYPFFTCSQETLRIDNYAYDCECVLIAGNGELNAKYYNGKFNAYQRTYIITTKTETKNVSVKYLYKFFAKYIEQLRKLSIGGVIKYIKLGNLTDAFVLVPPLPEQERIVAELDCLSDVIEKQKQQLKELDNLAQAIFYDMFGDPITNEKGWEVKKLGEVCRFSQGVQVDVSLQSTEMKEGWSQFLRIVDYTTDNTDIRYVEVANKKYSVEYDDIVIVRYGASAGFVGINKKGILANNLFKLNHDRTILHCKFLYYQLSTDYYRNFVKEVAFGAAMPALSFSSFNNFNIAIPPLSIQQEFACKIEAIEKQKELIKQSLSETETLFNSRMDYYFN